MSDIFILDEDNEKKLNSGNEKKIYNQSIIERIDDYLLQSQSLKTKQKVVFFRLLSIMLNSGLTLAKSVKILLNQEKKKSIMSHILNKFYTELKSGQNLSYCFSMFPSSFNNAEVGMVESGEKTGKLNTSLRDLADQVEKISSINGKLKSALMYPAAIILVLFGVIVVMMVLVVPRLLDIFAGEGNLPASTRSLIMVSNFFVHYWWLIIGVFLGTFIGGKIRYKSLSGKYFIDKYLLKIPIIGGVSQKIILSKFSRVLAGMLKSGVSIVESLRITSEAVGNEFYRQRILFLRDDIKKGLKIYESLEGDPLFPEMMVSMIQIGEQSAKIDEVILKVADFYDEEVDNTVGVINKLLEPIIIVVMAVTIGYIAIAIMQPIMNLADTITNT